MNTTRNTHLTTAINAYLRHVENLDETCAFNVIHANDQQAPVRTCYHLALNLLHQINHSKYLKELSPRLVVGNMALRPPTENGRVFAVIAELHPKTEPLHYSAWVELNDGTIIDPISAINLWNTAEEYPEDYRRSALSLAIIDETFKRYFTRSTKEFLKDDRLIYLYQANADLAKRLASSTN